MSKNIDLGTTRKKRKRNFLKRIVGDVTDTERQQFDSKFVIWSLWTLSFCIYIILLNVIMHVLERYCGYLETSLPAQMHPLCPICHSHNILRNGGFHCGAFDLQTKHYADFEIGWSIPLWLRKNRNQTNIRDDYVFERQKAVHPGEARSSKTIRITVCFTLVVVMAFPSLARILGECSKIYSLLAPFFRCCWKWRIARTHWIHSLCQDQPTMA